MRDRGGLYAGDYNSSAMGGRRRHSARRRLVRHRPHGSLGSLLWRRSSSTVCPAAFIGTAERRPASHVVTVVCPEGEPKGGRRVECHNCAATAASLSSAQPQRARAFSARTTRNTPPKDHPNNRAACCSPISP